MRAGSEGLVTQEQVGHVYCMPDNIGDIVAHALVELSIKNRDAMDMLYLQEFEEAEAPAAGFDIEYIVV